MVERGNAAEEVLRSEAFQMAANALMDIYIQGIIQSSPEEKEKTGTWLCPRPVLFKTSLVS